MNDPQSVQISIVIPVHNGQETLAKCLEAVAASQYAAYECIVVDDGSNDGTPEIARQQGARLIELTEGPYGPAFARNAGARAADGDILFFVDADVLITPDTLGKIAATFVAQPHIAALFGSYDENPYDRSFLSQYKNLLHHFVHQQGREEAATFWSGCGAIRKSVFEAVGGFDDRRYPRPSIEDIELGYRLTTAGHKVMLHKGIQVKHLKHWSLAGLIKTDVFDRAFPWAALILQYRNMPNDLNLQTSQRLSALLLGVMLLHILINALQSNLILLPLLAGLFLTLAGSWQWHQGPLMFRLNHRAQTVTYFLMGAIFILALFGGLPQLLLPLALLLPVTLAGHYWSEGSPLVKRIVFITMMLAILFGFGLLIASYPPGLVWPFMIFLGLIWLLNNRLYTFLAQKRGLAFAVAALPFQLSYYLYSTLAFLVSGGIHLWNSAIKSR